MEETKKRVPIKELRKAGKEAKEKLIKLGIIYKDFELQALEKEHGILLPGIPPYLPHQYTIKTAQRMMYDIVKIWILEHEEEQERLSLFVEFTTSEMLRLEDLSKKRIEVMGRKIKTMKKIPVIGTVFSPVDQYETTKAMKMFFIHSFATCIAIKGEASTTTEFIEWFFEWTEKMYEIWEKKKSNRV